MMFCISKIVRTGVLVLNSGTYFRQFVFLWLWGEREYVCDIIWGGGGGQTFVMKCDKAGWVNFTQKSCDVIYGQPLSHYHEKCSSMMFILSVMQTQ